MKSSKIQKHPLILIKTPSKQKFSCGSKMFGGSFDTVIHSPVKALLGKLADLQAVKKAESLVRMKPCFVVTALMINAFSSLQVFFEDHVCVISSSFPDKE